LGYFSFFARDAFEAAKIIEKETARAIRMIIAMMMRFVVLCSGEKLRFSQIISDGSDAG
jgi:hypothetical protein